MFCSRKLIGIFAVCALVSGTCKADLIFSLSPSAANVGVGGGTVSFTASVVGTAGEQLQAYDLFFDVLGLDLTAPPTPVQVSNIAVLPTITGLNTPVAPENPAIPAGADFGASVFAFAPTPVGGGVDLFTFDAIFDANAGPETTYDFAFDPSIAGSGASGVGIDFGTSTFNGASVTVAGSSVAVPEPSSALLVATALVPMVSRRKRKAT